jgi:hypothetical protein
VFAMSALNNIIYLDQGNSNKSWQFDLHGGPNWVCGTSCQQYWLADYNLYYSTAVNLGSATTFAFTTDGSGNKTYYTVTNWSLNAKQDQHSFVQDPLFIGPGYANGDNYQLQANSPAGCIDWATIPYGSIGPNTAVLPPYPTSIPYTYPLQLLDKNSGY